MGDKFEEMHQAYMEVVRLFAEDRAEKKMEATRHRRIRMARAVALERRRR